MTGCPPRLLGGKAEVDTADWDTDDVDPVGRNMRVLIRFRCMMGK